MPHFLGLPIIAWIQMAAGLAVTSFVLVKFCIRPKKKKTDGYIIKDVHIITGDGNEMFHQNVYIKNGLIQKISGEDISAPEAATIDGKGKTLMPGLIDSHVHIQGINNKSDKESDAFLYGQLPEIFGKVLPYGITTVKDLCAPRHFIYKLKNELKKGRITGPELLVVGPNFTAPGGHPAKTLGGSNPWMRKEMAIEAETPEQISAGIKELKADGVDFLKMTYQGGDYLYFGEHLQIAKLDRSLMEQLIREGKENGLNTTAHVYYKNDVQELLEAGIYGIEHGVLDEQLSADDELVQLWKKSGAHFVPTVNGITYENDPVRYNNSIHNLKILHDAGIFMAMGTDTMYEMMTGETAHKELAYYVEAGLTPMEALTLATRNSAIHLGIADRKGLVKEGMEADLILLEKNPAEDISNIQFIDKVFLKGKPVFSQKAIQSYNIPDYTYPEGASVLTYTKAASNEKRIVHTEAFCKDRTVTQKLFSGGEKSVDETYVLDGNLSCNRWHYERPADGTNLEAVKNGEYISLKGTFRGKAQEKNYKIGDGLWYQMMEMAMPAFITSEEEEIVFYSIGTGNNRGALGLGEFAAKKLGDEKITVAGKTVDCWKISMVLTAFSWAWTGFYWYDKITGQLVMTGEKGKNADSTHWEQERP